MRAVLVFSALLLVGLAAEVIGDPPTTPIPLTEGSCLNGGVFINEECDCQPYWGGRDCGDIVCVNGGYSTPDGFCHCPKGYYGIHCDAVKLARPVEGVFRTKQTFNLYIHNELTDWYGLTALQRIQNQTKTLLNDYKYDLFNLFVSKRKNTLLTTETDADVWNFQQFKTEDEFLPALEAVTPRRTHTYTCTEAAEFSYQKLLDSLKPITTVTSTSTTTTESIEDSTILIFTQYPPKSDPDALPKLKEYLRAFRIKLNVLIGADDILLDCNLKKNKGEKFKELTDLVHFTDGEISSFLMETDDSPDQLSPSFIRASASPQSHSRSTSDDCANKANTFEFQTDPYPNTYYIAVRTDQDSTVTISGTCSSGGEVTNLAVSEWGEFTLSSILSGAQQTCTLTVATKKGGCLATVYSVGGEKDVDRFDIFHSFATSDAMDTDSIHSFKKDNFYLTMHIDVWSFNNELPKYLITEFNGTATVWNEKEIEDSVFDLVKRDKSAYEYQSNKLFSCPDDGVSWIQLTLNGFNINGDIVSVLNRIIHLNCEDRAAPVDPTPPKLFRLDAEETTPRPDITLALLYSNTLPTAQFSRFILEGVDGTMMKDKFTNYGYLRFNGNDPANFIPDDDFDIFRRNVYDHAPDADVPFQDNLVDRLEKLTAGEEKNKVKHDSLVSIAIDRPMSQSRQPPKNLPDLSNLGSRLLFWGDVDTVKIQQFSDRLGLYTRLAAVSAGHFILMDMDDFPDDDDSGDFYLSFALRDLYSSGPSQRLLSYSNLEWPKPDTQTSTSSPIGSLQVPEGTSQVFVSITLNVEDPKDVGNAFMLSLVLEGATDRIVLDLSKLKQYGSPGFTRSNLYTASFTVKGGETYEGTFTLLAITPYTGAHIRFWTARDIEDPIPNLTYEGFEKNTIQPDDYYGAALRVPDDTGVTMALRFYDRNGNEALRNDHNQTVDVTGGKAHFVPYFCNSNQPDSNFTKDMYTIEITYDTGFKYFRPMLCSKGKPAEDACKEVRDDNTYCTESNPPFHRGPSQKLVDCSEAGQVKYSEDSDAVNNYKCFCDPGSFGVSCEQSICLPGIDHHPEEEDALYRTLSYVIISPAGPEACTTLNQFYIKDAKLLFNKGQTTTYDNIWQYTFSVYFADGSARTVYRGPSYKEFLNTFDKLASDDFDTANFCGKEDPKPDDKPLDLNEAYNVAVESVGRNSRGIVFFYVVQTFADVVDNKLVYALDSSDLYQSIQAYQQHIYMVTPTITPAFISMTTASGGFVVRLQNTYDGDYDASWKKLQKILEGLFQSKIGWAAVSTESKPIEWKVNQNAELFITTLTDNEGNPPVVTAQANATEDKFSYDDGDGDTVTRHFSVVGTETAPVIVNVAFEASAKYENVQVVILTTVDPIRNALIGQSQYADKHDAGATNTSEKAVHISFNRLSSEVFIKPQLDNWRQATRINCSFAQEFVAFQQPFETAGPYVVDFIVTPLDDDENLIPTGNFSLAVPLAVSEIIDCVNGEFDALGSFCTCDPGWSGPTCSQPSCGEGGTLNSHGDHCDCTGAEYGGLFCTDGKKSSFFEE